MELGSATSRLVVPAELESQVKLATRFAKELKDVLHELLLAGVSRVAGIVYDQLCRFRNIPGTGVKVEICVDEATDAYVIVERTDSEAGCYFLVKLDEELALPDTCESDKIRDAVDVALSRYLDVVIEMYKDVYKVVLALISVFEDDRVTTLGSILEKLEDLYRRYFGREPWLSDRELEDVERLARALRDYVNNTMREIEDLLSTVEELHTGDKDTTVKHECTEQLERDTVRVSIELERRLAWHGPAIDVCAYKNGKMVVRILNYGQSYSLRLRHMDIDDPDHEHISEAIRACVQDVIAYLRETYGTGGTT